MTRKDGIDKRGIGPLNSDDQPDTLRLIWRFHRDSLAGRREHGKSSRSCTSGAAIPDDRTIGKCVAPCAEAAVIDGANGMQHASAMFMGKLVTYLQFRLIRLERRVNRELQDVMRLREQCQRRIPLDTRRTHNESRPATTTDTRGRQVESNTLDTAQ
jgi:hypothetical protein